MTVLGRLEGQNATFVLIQPETGNIFLEIWQSFRFPFPINFFSLNNYCRVMQNKQSSKLYTIYFTVWMFYLENLIFISYWIIDIFEVKKSKRKNCKQNESSTTYQYFNKIAILNKDNRNVNKVLVWISQRMNKK